MIAILYELGKVVVGAVLLGAVFGGKKRDETPVDTIDPQQVKEYPHVVPTTMIAEDPEYDDVTSLPPEFLKFLYTPNADFIGDLPQSTVYENWQNNDGLKK